MSEELERPTSEPLFKKIPVTLLTGFLGAGKTTLINHLLEHPGNEKIAIIVNEFGKVGIDGQLIVRSDETMVELSNGCVCCTVRTDLIRTLTDLVEQKLGMKEGVSGNFTRIIIETTGLADPVPLLQTFALDEVVATCYTLEQVVTVVDARHFHEERRYLPLAEEQVAFADLIVLNKCDLQNDAALTLLEEELHSINPLATCVRTTQGVVSAATLFQTKSIEHVVKNEKPDDTHHDHLSDIHSVTVSTLIPIDLDNFIHWLGELLAHHGPDIFRYKGIVYSHEWPHLRGVLQGVHTLYTVLPEGAWLKSEQPKTTLVFIGRLDEAWIEQSFQKLIQSARRS